MSTSRRAVVSGRRLVGEAARRRAEIDAFILRYTPFYGVIASVMAKLPGDKPVTVGPTYINRTDLGGERARFGAVWYHGGKVTSGFHVDFTRHAVTIKVWGRNAEIVCNPMGKVTPEVLAAQLHGAMAFAGITDLKHLDRALTAVLTSAGVPSANPPLPPSTVDAPNVDQS